MMMDRRGLLAGAVALAARPALAAGVGDLAGDWSAVMPAGPNGERQIVRMRIGGDGRITPLPPGRVSASGEISDGPLPPARRTQVRTLMANRLELFWPGKDDASLLLARQVSPDRIEGGWAQMSFAGQSTPVAFDRGPRPRSLQLQPETFTDLGFEASRILLDVPALVAGGQKKGDPARFWRNGERVLGRGQPVQAGDRFMLGSCTKSFTGTLVARLAEAGLISWDDKVWEALRDVAPEMRPEYRDMTYRHLLSHRAGIEKDSPLAAMALAQLRYNADPMGVRRTLTRAALQRPPAARAESEFFYSNLGYVVAGSMMEARLGVPWDVLIKRHVAEPLGLSSAGVGPPRGDQPWGHHEHTPINPDALNADNPYGPPGKLHMSIEDLIIYLAAHRDRPSFLKPESWTRLHTPPFGGDYAMGWAIDGNGNLVHSGSNNLWYAQMVVTKERVAASLTNRAVGSGIYGQAARSV